MGFHLQNNLMHDAQVHMNSSSLQCDAACCRLAKIL